MKLLFASLAVLIIALLSISLTACAPLSPTASSASGAAPSAAPTQTAVRIFDPNPPSAAGSPAALSYSAPISLPSSAVRQSGGKFACGVHPSNGLSSPHPRHFLHWAQPSRDEYEGDGYFVFDRVAIEAVPLTDDSSGYAEVSSVDILAAETGRHNIVVDANPDHWPIFPFYADISPTDTIAYTSCEFLPDGWESSLYWYDENDTEIAIIELRGDLRGNRKRLTDNDVDEYFPVWSPNGDRIAFVSHPNYYSLDQEEYWITIMDVDDASEVRIQKALLHPPAWSPNGKEIAFIRGDYNRNGPVGYGAVEIDLFTARSDGSEEPQLLTSIPTTWENAPGSRLMSLPFGGPSWSPDGNWIAFGSSGKSSKASEGGASVFVVSSDGANSETVWQGRSSFPVTQVSWSPDGREILFIATDVFVVRPDGSGLRRIDPFVHPRKPQYAAYSPQIVRADWSPDSSRIALYDGQRTITTVKRDGTDVRVYPVPCGRCLYGH